jgi:hypothetical protein
MKVRAMRILGYILFLGAGAILYAFEVIWLHRWWGSVGLVVGIFVPPIGYVFPFICWAKLGFVPVYFVLLGLSVFGIVLISRGHE